MRISASARCVVVASTALGMLAACSGGSHDGGFPALPNSPQQQSSSASRAGNGKGMTYVAPIGTTTVYGYQRNNRTNQPPVCTVGPFVSVNGGIAVDRSGNLWVPDMGAVPKTVTEYGPDCGAAKTVLSTSQTLSRTAAARETSCNIPGRQ
jgi:hypothetical protein